MSDDNLRKYYANQLKRQEYLKIGFKQGFEAGYAKAKEDFGRPQGEWVPCTKEGLPLTEYLCRYEAQKWYGYKCSHCTFIYKGNALTQSPYCQKCGSDNRKKGDENA